jgi:uncharacterized protein
MTESPDPAPIVPPSILIAPRILVDADDCPVEEEIYKIAWCRNVPVVLFSTARFRIPDRTLITMAMVSDSFDAADDGHAKPAALRNEDMNFEVVWNALIGESQGLIARAGKLLGGN